MLKNKKIKQAGLIGISVLSVLAVAGCAKEKPLSQAQVEKQIQTKDIAKSSVKLYTEAELQKIKTENLSRTIFETQNATGTLFDKLSNAYSEADKDEKLRDNKEWQETQATRLVDIKANLTNAQTLIDYTSKRESFGADTDKVVDSQKFIKNFFTIKSEALEIGYEQLIRHDDSYKSKDLEEKKTEMQKMEKKAEEEAKKEMSQ